MSPDIKIYEASEHLTNFLPFLLVLITVLIPTFNHSPEILSQNLSYNHHHESSYAGADVAQCRFARKESEKKRASAPLANGRPKGRSAVPVTPVQP